MLSSPYARELRRAISRRRSLLAAGLAAGSVAAALNVLVPQPAPGLRVLTAARDLTAGTALAAADLRVVELPPGVAPVGVLQRLDDALGRVLAAPMRDGEPLTDVRLTGSGLLPASSRGLVAAAVRVADAAAAALVTAGDRVDVLAAASTQSTAAAARLVAGDVEVLAVPTAVRDDGDGALLVVAVTPSTAASLAAAAVSSRLSVTVRPRA